MVDPDLKLTGRGGGGVVLLALPAFLPSVIFSFTQIMGGGGRGQAPLLDPPNQSSYEGCCLKFGRKKFDPTFWGYCWQRVKVKTYSTTTLATPAQQNILQI